MLESLKTNVMGQPFVNIINIRKSFEKHARKLIVAIEALEDKTSEMEKKSVVTRYGRKASFLSTIMKSTGKSNRVKDASEVSKDNRTVRDDFVTTRHNRGVKKNVEREQDVTKASNLNDIRITSLVEIGKQKTIVKDSQESKKKTVKFVKLKAALDSTIDIPTKRIRKPNVKYFNESFQVPSKRTSKILEKPKRILIYNKEIDDSDFDVNKKKKDIYKFTDFDKSDINSYDKETDKIMINIHKAEKIKAKKRNKKPRAKKEQLSLLKSTIDVEINFSRNNNEKFKTYSTKLNKNKPEEGKILILADVVVHASLNMTEKSFNKPLSIFDKLKLNQNPIDHDIIQEVYQNSPEPLMVSPADDYSINNTSPLINTAKNTPANNSSTKTLKPIRYTPQIDVHYDSSNNFGFNEDAEENDPENRVLVLLNEASRKLQKRTPWRNRLIIRNKRILTVKTSSLPCVDQDLILDSTIVEKLSHSIAEAPHLIKSKKQVQTRLDPFLGTDFEENAADLSTLFDSNNLSPIKHLEGVQKKLFQSTLTENLISTPRMTVRRNVLLSKNSKTSNIIESEDIYLNSAISAIEDSVEIEDLAEDSYFGFISPPKNGSKENVLTPLKVTSPSKLPIRIDSGDLRRFRKKYVGKKQRAVEEKKLNESVNEENNLSDDLPMLGLFDELLAIEPEEERKPKKRCRINCEAADKISRIKKKRQKKELSDFNKWAEKFNKMCKAVEKHKLYVE